MSSSALLTQLPLVFPMVCADHAARLAGRSVREAVTDASVLAEVLVSAQQYYDSDLILVFSDTMVEAEALGCEIELPEDDCPYLRNACAQLPRKPADELAGRIPVVLSATRKVKATATVPVFTGLKGPFSLACFLAGVETFLIQLRSEPDSCHELLRFGLAHQQAYADAIVAAGGMPFIGDPLASGDIVSRRNFADFALPYLRELVSHIHRAGSPAGLHICGDTSDRLEMMGSSGADVLSLDEVDLRCARQTLGSGVVLMGNVSTQLLASGSPEQVRLAAEACLSAAGPRLILSSACDVPTNAPPENIKALVDALP